jgi:chemotaxis protein MotA
MDRRTLILLSIALTLLGLGAWGSGDLHIYANGPGLLIVLGGTMAAALVAFPWQRLVYTSHVVRTACRTKRLAPEKMVEILVDLAVKSRIRGIHSLAEDEREASVLFLRQALGLVVDNYPREQIYDILSTEMACFQDRREESERVLRVLADFAPAFGLAGSVVGLMGMLSGMGDVSAMIQAIPVALTSTLYGVLLAHLVFLPLAARVREATAHELLLQRIVAEAMISIQEERNPRHLETKLKRFLTPAQRGKRLVSLARIQERFGIGRQDTEKSSDRSTPSQPREASGVSTEHVAPVEQTQHLA